ncbi:hypothetical protein BKA58DRAFT_457316 [Alternaria rosae]|uniref:uncharacterized protein n=1 Tax=Alternaria rosae TaxID=1187941 RepID=UPI001E8E45D9|nr:uncharacterized protein BKA58DRAFT_457316 [Alternaria rosae]KAH6870038.1 hypothetical protein BKA58DRAFT_457316 [Alternaria rosae]
MPGRPGALLHSFDASSRRHLDRLGRLRDHSRAVIRPGAHVAHAGPDAISCSQRWRPAAVQHLASRRRPGRLHPGALDTSSLSGCGLVAAPNLAAGSRSCALQPLIRGVLVASSPLRPAAGLCRHPPCSAAGGATIFPRCNPTLPRPALQFAVTVWGVVGVATAKASLPLREHAGTWPTRCGPHPSCTSLKMTTSSLNILASSMPRHFASFILAEPEPCKLGP